MTDDTCIECKQPSGRHLLRCKRLAAMLRFPIEFLSPVQDQYTTVITGVIPTRTTLDDEPKLEILDQLEKQGDALERHLERLVEGPTSETDDRDARRARLRHLSVKLITWLEPDGNRSSPVISPKDYRRLSFDLLAELQASKRDREALAKAEAEIEAWKDASGLTCGGDPDGVRPEVCGKYWQRQDMLAAKDREALAQAREILKTIHTQLPLMAAQLVYDFFALWSADD